MSAYIDVKIEGFAALDKKLQEFPLNVQKRVMTNAVRAGARVFAAEAKKNAPESLGQYNYNGKIVKFKGERGFLKKNIIVKADPKRAPGVIRYNVGPSSKAFFGSFIEYGWVAGKIARTHVPARPWIRPAFDTANGPAMLKIRSSMRAGIERETARMAVKKAR